MLVGTFRTTSDLGGITSYSMSIYLMCSDDLSMSKNSEPLLLFGVSCVQSCNMKVFELPKKSKTLQDAKLPHRTKGLARGSCVHTSAGH